MELATILRRLWRHRILTALAVLVASVAAVLSVYHVDGSGLSQSTSHFGAAQTEFYVDTRRPSLITSQATAQDLISRAKLVANFIGSGQVRSAVAQVLGVRPGSIQVVGPFPDQPGAGAQPVAQQRANQLIDEGSPYNVFVDTELSSPTVTLFVQAPTGALAMKLAAAVPDALSDYLNQLTRDAVPAERVRFARTQIPTTDPKRLAAQRAAGVRVLGETLSGRTVIRALGEPVAGTVATQSGRAIGGLVFVVVLIGCLLLVLAFASMRSRRLSRSRRSGPRRRPA